MDTVFNSLIFYFNRVRYIKPPLNKIYIINDSQSVSGFDNHLLTDM